MASPSPKGWAPTPGRSAGCELERDRDRDRSKRARTTTTTHQESELDRGRPRGLSHPELRVYWHNMDSDRNHDEDSEMFVGMDDTLPCDVADYLRALADFLRETRRHCRLHLLTCTESSVNVVVDTRLDLATVISIMRRCRVHLPSDFYTSGSAVPRSEYTNVD